MRLSCSLKSEFSADGMSMEICRSKVYGYCISIVSIAGTCSTIPMPVSTLVTKGCRSSGETKAQEGGKF